MPKRVHLGADRSQLTRYAIAILAVAAASGACWLAGAAQDPAPFAPLLLCAAVFAAWYGGLGPGLAASVLASLFFLYLFVPPSDSFALPASALASLALFAASVLFVVGLGAAQRRTADALRRARDRLQEAVGGLENANRALQAENAERRQAEQRTREAQQELQATIDTIPVLIATYHPDGTRDFVNKSWQDYTGIPLERAHGRDWAIALHPDDFDEGQRLWHTSLATGQPVVMEQRFRRADGAYRWHLVRRVPLRDERDEVVRWYSVGYDIEDRKQADAALAQAEQELRLIVDRIPALVWQTREDGQVEYANKPWLDYTGMAPAEALGWGYLAAIHPDDRPLMAEAWRRIRTSGLPEGIEARMRRHDGQYRWFLFSQSPLRDDAGRIVRWYGSNIDIEDRKRAEDGLRRSEAYLAEAQKLSRTGSFAWTPASGGMVLSGEACRILEIEPSGRPTLDTILRRVHPDDLAAVRQQIDRSLAGDHIYDHENRALMPDGTVKRIHVRAHRVTYASGQDEIVGALIDVTAARTADEALQAAQAHLAHASRVTMLGEMSASIAHEVSQPLAAIIMSGEAGRRWLARATPDIDRALEAIDGMVGSADHATRIIQNIRALARKAEPVMSPLDVNGVIEEALALVQREASNHRVPLQRALAPGLPPVRGDRTQLQQVIINLVLNGLQATAGSDGSGADDSRLAVTVRTERPDGDRVRIVVEDAGAGVEPDKLGRLFTPFYTTKPNGMGMGLSICRSIVESHGGELRASRNAGRGMTFAFTVPAAPDGPAP